MTYTALPVIAIFALATNGATPEQPFPLLPTPSVQVAPTCDEWGTDGFFDAHKKSARPWIECIRGGVNPNIPVATALPNVPVTGWFIGVATVEPEMGKEVFSALIDAGADVNAKMTLKGLTAPLLLFAVSFTGQFPVHMEMTDALLTAGADPTESVRAIGGRDVREQGISILHFAARAADPAVVPMLVNAGADIHASGQDGTTPLHAAARGGDNPEMIRAMLAAGADLHAPGESGETPLHTAAGHNDNREVIDALLAAGADINAKSNLGTTPLHYATSFARTTTGLEALLDAGADPNILDHLNNLPIDYAEENRAIRGTDAYFRLIRARLR